MWRRVVAISLLMLSMRWLELRAIAIGAMWCVVVLTVVSAVQYFRSFWRKVDIKVKRRRRRELLMKQARERRMLKQNPLAPPGNSAKSADAKGTR